MNTSMVIYCMPIDVWKMNRVKGRGHMRIKKFEDLLQGELAISLVGQKMFVSVFLMDGLLIDTGPSKKQSELIQLFSKWDIKNVILTHHHEDHTGTAGWIAKNKNIPVYIHETGIQDCEKMMKLPFYRKAFWGERSPFQPIALGEIFETDHYTWEIIHTPGHAHDHIALYNREKKWMFGGDLYVQSTPKSLFAFESIPTIIESLKKLLTYDFETYICSHKGVIIQGRKVIERKLDYLLVMQQEVLTLYAKGLSPKEIRKKMFPQRHPMHYFSLFENSPKHIIHSILK